MKLSQEVCDFNHLRDGDVKGRMKDIVLDTIWVVDLLHSWQTQGLET